MNSKLIMAIAVIAAAFCFVALPAEDVDAATTATITVTAGTGGTATGGGTFEEGDTVTLTATPNSGYHFVNWTFTGGSSLVNPLSFQIQAPMLGQSVTYTANFAADATYYTVYFQSSNSSYGSVSRASITNVPNGASISVSGSTVTINGTSCYATAASDTAQYDYSFASWSNASGTVTSDRTITANFTRSTNTYTVSFVSSNSSYGTVSPSTISGVPYGSAITVSGSTVTINGTSCYATPATDTAEYDYSFTGWSNTSGSVTGSRTITANFSRTTSTATITVVAGAGGSATGGGTYYLGDTVTLTATPNTGYRFVNWTFSGGSSVANPLSYEIQAPMLGNSVTYTANFEEIPTATITVTSSGHGSASGGGTFNLGDTVTLTATPDAGYRFVNWTFQGGSSVANPLSYEIQEVMLGQSVTYTANFEEIPSATITVTSSGNGTATGGGTYYLGDTVTLTATPSEGYRFVNWTFTGGSSTANPLTYEIQAPMLGNSVTYTANFEEIPSATIIVNSSGNGSVTGGGTYYLGDTVTLTATPDAGYSFINWVFQGGTSTANPLTYEIQEFMLEQTVTYTANFGNEVYWSNDNYNGSVTLAFRFTGGSNNQIHMMDYQLYKPTTINGQTTWNYIGYKVHIEISYYPRTIITASVMNNGIPVGSTETFNAGQWPIFTLTLDANTSKIIFTPVSKFNDFTDFTTMDSQAATVMDYSAVTDRNTIWEIAHEDTGSGAHVNFSVTSTDVFLNTYGVVLYYPSINPFSYFPEYQSIRLDFRSFAIYGDSFMINGNTFQVDRGTVTFWYTVDTEKVNHIASEGTEGALQKTLQLSNIQVTWENGSVSLTFVNDRFTVDLGEYSAGSETISFQGYWYFTTTLGEPYTVTERSISGDWKSVPDIGTSAILLIFLGILLIGGLVAHAKLGLKWLDAIIVICSLIFAYALLR